VSSRRWIWPCRVGGLAIDPIEGQETPPTDRKNLVVSFFLAGVGFLKVVAWLRRIRSFEQPPYIALRFVAQQACAQQQQGVRVVLIDEAYSVLIIRKCFELLLRFALSALT
jgi:hypothetical protein